eukprot:c18489_g1_i1.p1 GENE.c18489_g1_i1~~c18489_g1_i1.p1  ORF type:complete len:336 (-),score=70.13 c18489_g1_i1:127-1083(-)
MPLGEKVAVQDHPQIGKGIFAVQQIEAGEVVWWWDQAEEILHTFSRAEIVAIPGEVGDWLRKYSYFVEEDLFGSQPQDKPMDISYYFNHTCDPNCWYDGDEKLIAMRTILPGEHVAYDYGMTETELSNHAGMQCLCGAKQCRGLLDFRQYRDPEWLAKYEPHCEAFIRRKAAEKGDVNSKIYLRHESTDPSKPPRGLYALKNIEKGEIVVVFGEHASIKTTSQATRKAHQRVYAEGSDNTVTVAQLVGGDRNEKSDQVNHSCNPSASLKDDVVLVADRAIEIGEEITFNYASLISAGSEFKCACGASNCTGSVQHPAA